MERRVIGSVWEKLIAGDYNKLGTYPQASFDTVVGKLLIPNIAFEGFSVVQSSLTTVTVGNGHLSHEGKMYVNDTTGGVDIDLSTRVPVVSKRIVTIAVFGEENDTSVTSRTFLTDADTRTTIAQPVATTHVRWASPTALSGVENARPLAPAVASNVCPVAYVTLTPDGIESIVVASEYLMPTLRDVDNRLNEYDLWKKTVGTRLDTLAADLLELSNKIYGLSTFTFVLRMAQDVARLKLLNGLSQTYVNWSADWFMNEDNSQTDDPAYLAKIEEGLKPPAAATSDSQLGLLDVNDELVIDTSSVLLPKWTAAVRVTNLGSDDQLAINTYQYQTFEMTQQNMTRSRYRYGAEFVVTAQQLANFLHTGSWDGTSSNPAAVWDPLEGVYKFYTGEEFAILGTYTQIINTGGYAGSSVGAAAPATESQTMIRLAQRFVDYYDEPYWALTTTEGTVSGVAVAQTFLNSQDGWLSSIDLYFSAIADAGDVTCLLCETTNGAPDLNKVIAQSTLTVDDLVLSPAATSVTTSEDSPPIVEGMLPTTFTFDPTFLSQERYAFVLVTAGAHSLWQLVDTNYVSGTLFYSTDGDWFLGDLAHDLAFRVSFCKFAQNTTQVELLPLQLTGGIASIDILAQAVLPTACNLKYEIYAGSQWVDLDDTLTSPATVLASLPETLRFRVTFVGTEYVQPCLGVAANSRVRCYRPRNDFVHISTTRSFDSSCSTVTAKITVNKWLGSPHHTFTAKLLHGVGFGTTRSPDITVSEVNPEDPDSMIFTFTWNGMGAIDECRFRLEGVNDNILTPFVVGERVDVDIT